MGCTVTKAKQRKKIIKKNIYVAVRKINLTPEIVRQKNLTLT